MNHYYTLIDKTFIEYQIVFIYFTDIRNREKDITCTSGSPDVSASKHYFDIAALKRADIEKIKPNC